MNTGDPVRSAHGLPAMDYFHADRRPVWRRSPGPDAFLRRAIPVHGLRPADLPRKPARHRDLPLGPRMKLYNGLPPAGPALDAGRCQRKGDWRIHAAWPSGVIPRRGPVRRRRTGVGPDQYRLRHDSTISLCACRSSVGALPHHQGGGGCTAARPAGQHSEFYPHRMASARRSWPRYALAGSRSHHVVDRGYVDLEADVLHQAGALFVTAKSNRCSSRLGADGFDRHHLRQTIALDGFYPVRITPNFAAHPGPRVRQDAGLHTQQLLPAATICAGYKSRWQEELFPSGSSSIFGSGSSTARRRTRWTQIWIAVSVYVARRHLGASTILALHFDRSSRCLRENAHTSSTCGRRKQMQRFANNQPIEYSIFNRTLVIPTRE